MNLDQFKQVSDFEWHIAPSGKMRVPAVIYADRTLITEMDDKVHEQITNVATLPGIVQAAYAMPTHTGATASRSAGWRRSMPTPAAWFPPAGWDSTSPAAYAPCTPAAGCRYRTAQAAIGRPPVHPHSGRRGSTGLLRLNASEMDAMLRGGARWAVEQGYGSEADLDRIEEHGCMAGAEPDQVSDQAKRRQRDEIGTLGSGNHYLELQEIVEIYDIKAAERFRLRQARWWSAFIADHAGWGTRSAPNSSGGW